MSDDALVSNASDPRDIERATRKTRLSRKDENRDLRTVLGTVEGRRVLWRLLEHCRVFSSVYDDHGPRMAYYSGRQDVGHFIVKAIDDANPDAMFQMMAARRKQEKQDRDENEAHHATLRDANDFDA